jgi:cell division protein ZapA
MALVAVRIAGRPYELACDDGQEEHLRRLADDIDERMRGLIKGMGTHPGESLGFLLTALTMADEIMEYRRENRQVAAEVQRLAAIVNEDSRSGQQERMADIEQAMAVTLEEIAVRIEKIADQVEMR